MAIKPIDMQTNISQMHEVGKGEQARTEAAAEQQHLLDKESGEKSKLVNTRLDESKKGEQAAIKDKEKEGRGGSSQYNEENDEKGKGGKKKATRVIIDDERMGRIIDIKK